MPCLYIHKNKGGHLCSPFLLIVNKPRHPEKYYVILSPDCSGPTGGEVEGSIHVTKHRIMNRSFIPKRRDSG